MLKFYSIIYYSKFKHQKYAIKIVLNKKTIRFMNGFFYILKEYRYSIFVGLNIG